MCGGYAAPKFLEISRCDCYHTNYNGIVDAWPQMGSCAKDLSHLVPKNLHVILKETIVRQVIRSAEVTTLELPRSRTAYSANIL